MYSSLTSFLPPVFKNNANEGAVLVPPTINTQDDLVNWIQSRFPYLSDRHIARLLETYPSVEGPVNASEPRYETDGYGPATAVNVSQIATGQQQRAYASNLGPTPFFSLKLYEFKGQVPSDVLYVPEC